MDQLLTEPEALARILEAVSATLETEICELWTASDRVIAADVYATVPLPRFDNSSMDGYAVRAVEAVEGARLAVRRTQAAGPAAGHELMPGEAIRIFTGAPIPARADAVVMQEECDRSGDAIVVRARVLPGENVRRAGEDLSAGQKICTAGTALQSPQLALLASQGVSRVEVRRRPDVAIIATGNELRSPGEALGPGEIFESNRVMLADLVHRAGAEPHPLPVVPDLPEVHEEAFLQAQRKDAIVVAGGVSVGEKDLVKASLRRLGGNVDLWRVAVRPGKPFMFGKLGSVPVFGLPGNPVSAFVTFLLFVRPALLKLGGRTRFQNPRIQAEAGEELRNSGDRPHYLRVCLRDGVVRLTGRQESHALFGLAQANALARLEPGQVVLAGNRVPVIRFGD
ncbi:MAG: molybdopterin molybdotransferase MoeA [Verrucomicrobia bacterium]|nr:molybdopterin molybdotransferase MoeA [Verrucomicrobiota bacterium]